MTVRTRAVGSRTGLLAGLLFSLAFARVSVAADLEATVKQLTTLNKAAIDAYSAGDFEKSKRQLLQAVALGKKDSEVQTHPLMARTYLHLGVLSVDGFEDRAGGIKYFVKALRIRPDIEVTQALETKTVKAAFEEARAEAKAAPETDAVATAPAPKTEETASEEAADEKPAPKMTAADKRKAAEEAKRAAAEEKRAAAEEKKKETEDRKKEAADEKRAAVEEKRQALEDKKKEAEEAKKAAFDEKRAAKEAKEKDHQAEQEKEKLMKELAAVQGGEAKERAAKEKLQTDKADKEKLLGESKAAEKQLQAEKDKLTKELAASKDSEAKERGAKEKLQADKAATDKQLVEAKASIDRLLKEKLEKEKQLADAATREKKEREAKEKLEKEKQVADAQDKDRNAREEKARVDREKLAAGPEMPSRLPEPLHCAVPDEAQANTELFVHCAARPDVNAKVLALYYRPSGSVHYNSLVMEPNKKGWKVAVIPADKVTGKLLQYYAEARNEAGKVMAATGKPTSPNILTLRSGSAVATGSGTHPAPANTTAGRTKHRTR